MNVKLRWFVVAFLFCLLSLGAAFGGGDQTVAPVRLADQAHRPTEVNDFLRLIFLPPGKGPSGKLGLVDAKSAFVGPAAYYQPGLPLKEIPQYSGLSNREDRTLLAIRCTPKDPAMLNPTLATWPNVFALISKDLGSSYKCPPEKGSPENDLFCLVKDYSDCPDSVAVYSVQKALTLAKTLFEDNGRKAVLQNRYAIYPEFSGLGFSVKTYGRYDPMTAAVVLEHSVVPEYLVKNVTLAEGGCKCIKVPPYEGRGNDVLDPDWISGLGTAECAPVDRLRPAR